ncbi:epithelial chloride channel protein-like [Acanthaster planci]|uniref:Epithelial chloride channel protein-like n=1 Tax=Acanthaster planci TaxID=133434 RepID=A0A8B7XME8_ACAPL|nr:epithelial chloride channel protein-like [Acanthaster planci]XP_022081164.1 epithelial chloride channel protein-like [Acanthaster planci]
MTTAIKWTTLMSLIILSAVHGADSLTRPSFIKFIDNGYSGITVAIHNRVDEDQVLIDRIQYMFKEASKYLYTATKKRAYFRNVTILIPKTWARKPEYDLPGGVTFDNADVIVAPPNPRWAPLQYTKQYEGCGKQGVHIHFLDAFLTNQDTELYYGPLGRMLVHEWAHLRWGLFDEYPDPVGDPDYYQEFYYSPLTQRFEGVRCSYNYNGRPLIFLPESFSYRDCAGDPFVGYEDNCVFFILQDQSDVTASIMFGTYPLEPITNFCDDTEQSNMLHNQEAPNKHNRLCFRKSNWEVMRGHEDFEGGKNPPREISDKDLIPTFRLVQHREIRVVLLLDTSGSMNDNEKFVKMISSSYNFLSSIVLDGSRVGIVEFNTFGKILKNLVAVNGAADRLTLLDALPSEADGWTAIGDGLLKAIEVLSANEESPKGGIIMLVSDGEEKHGNNGENPYNLPYVADVMDEVVASGVIVDTLAFAQEASALLPSISKATGGKTFFYSNEPGSNTLYEAFAAIMERGDVRDTDKRVQLLGTSWSLKKNEERRGGVFMDSTLGNGTAFTFSWSKVDNPAIEVTIMRPNGEILDSSYDGFGEDASFKTIIVRIQGHAEEGAWIFTVRNRRNGKQDVAIAVSSYPASDNVEPIVVTSELSGSITAFEKGEPLVAYAEVRQGFSPMIYANVTATIERPGGYDPVTVQLLDNGAGADITKNDGVYSRYFTEFTGIGYYGIRINVDNNGGDAIIIESNPFSKARPIVSPDKVYDLPEIGGIKIPPPGTPPAEPRGRSAPAFSRGISGGSSRVDEVPPGFSPGDDLFPPGDVLDLRATDSSFQKKTVTLAWTAPGDDLDNGAASRYEVIRAGSIQAWQNDSTPAAHLILNSSHILQGSLSTPQEFGNEEELVVLVPVPEGATVASYAFVLRAFDDAGNPSGFSNVVQAALRERIPEALADGLLGWQIALIVVGSIAVALLLIAGGVVAFKHFKPNDKKVKQSSNKETREMT